MSLHIYAVVYEDALEADLHSIASPTSPWIPQILKFY